MNITERYKYQIGNHDNDLDFTTESEIDKLIIARNKTGGCLDGLIAGTLQVDNHIAANIGLVFHDQNFFH